MKFFTFLCLTQKLLSFFCKFFFFFFFIFSQSLTSFSLAEKQNLTSVSTVLRRNNYRYIYSKTSNDYL
jgi:hypothetical protein